MSEALNAPEAAEPTPAASPPAALPQFRPGRPSRRAARKWLGDMLASRTFWLIALCLLAASVLVWLGHSMTTSDLLPGIGSATDRWWTALLLVSVTVAAAGFLSVVALVKWILTRDLGWRNGADSPLLFPTK